MRPTRIRDAGKLRDASEALRDVLVAEHIREYGELSKSLQISEYLKSSYYTLSRSPKWRKVREEYVSKNNQCVACGQYDNLNVHHIKPFYLFPQLELDTTNLLTLCEDGPAGMNCHLLVGHGGLWENYNPDVRFLASAILSAINNRKKD